MQQFAGLREVLCEVLQRRYGARTQRPWLRISAVAQPGVKARLITALGATALSDWAQHHDWPQCRPLLGAYDFDARDGVYAQHMQQWLTTLPDQALLMCHPATQAQTWDALNDPEILKACVPGCE